MQGKEDFLFWRLGYFLISEKNYRLLQVNEDQKVMWLEKAKNKKARIIRITASELSWGKMIKRDIDLVVNQSEALRKQLWARQLDILNIYIAAYPPVEGDFDFTDQIKKDRLTVTSLLLTRENEGQALELIGKIIQSELPFKLKSHYEETEIFMIHQTFINKAAAVQEEERKMFESSKPLFTYIFMAFQILMFIVLELNGGSKNPETLIAFGAKYNPLILEGQWWRFITPVFLHIGLLHLAMNTLALYYIGTAVERMFGRTRFIWIYLISGISGSVASFVFMDNLSAGASGAIFGCFGALLYIGVSYPHLFFRTIGMNVIALIVINLVFGFTVPGIDNAGHLGGLLGGFLATGIVHLPHKKKVKWQMSFSLALILSMSVILYHGYHSPSIPSLHALAQEKIDNGEEMEAYQLLKGIIEQGEGTDLTYFQLSYIEIQQEKYEQAKEHLEKAIQMNSNMHEAHFNLSILYYGEGDLEKAKEHAAIAVSLSSDEKYLEFLNRIREQEETDEISI